MNTQQKEAIKAVLATNNTFGADRNPDWDGITWPEGGKPGTLATDLGLYAFRLGACDQCDGCDDGCDHCEGECDCPPSIASIWLCVD